jgi:hypothetical protein
MADMVFHVRLPRNLVIQYRHAKDVYTWSLTKVYNPRTKGDTPLKPLIGLYESIR